MLKKAAFYSLCFIIIITFTLANNEIEIALTINILEDYDVCNFLMSIESEKSTYESGEAIIFEHVLNRKPENFQIEYWIEDLSGEIIKSKRNTTNLNKKSYTPKISVKEKVLVMKAILTTFCEGYKTIESEKSITVNNPQYIDLTEETSEETSFIDAETSKLVDKKSITKNEFVVNESESLKK
ncbi:MAG: hypothetical protein KKF65_01325, partial [Nanoarchaeota archaeon]|nr:hypothetical protein [Nanoarchaeota archaeon]